MNKNIFFFPDIKRFFFLLSIPCITSFAVSTARAQIGPSHTCGTKVMPVHEALKLEKTLEGIIGNTQRNTGTTGVPLYIHVVRNDGCSNGATNEEITIGIQNMNYHFQAAGIEFYAATGSPHNICNTTLSNFSNSEESTLCGPNDVNDAFNVYLVESISYNGNPASGYAYFPSNNAVSTRSFIEWSAISNDNGTWTHEAGHNFGLYHTHESFLGFENVPRSGSCSNCSSDGDFVCDTEADPEGPSSACTYTGTSTDSCGNSYTPPIENIMSYYSDACGEGFTAGQSVRAAAALVVRQGHSAYSIDRGPDTVTDPSNLTAVASSSEYSVDLSWTDNANNELGYVLERSTSPTSGFYPVPYLATGDNVTSISDNWNLASNTTYYYRVKGINDDKDHYSNVASVSVGQVYCTPSYLADGCGFTPPLAIHDVTVSQGGTNIITDNNSGCNSPLDIKNNVAPTMTVGTTYNITIGLASGGSWFAQNASVFIDLNRDGDFEDSNELVAQIPYAGTSTLATSFTLPSSGIVNGASVLRIRTVDNFNGGSYTDPCSEYIAFGETEDFQIVLAGSVVPVELSRFQAVKKQNGVDLEWEVGIEEGVADYIIERSTDNGAQFKKIGLVEAQDEKQYNFTDAFPLNGENYYRLRIGDWNGSYEYSQVEVIEWEGDKRWQCYPNPIISGGSLQVVFPETNFVEGETILLHVYNHLGQRVLEKQYWNSDVPVLNWDVNLPAGGYWLHLQNGRARYAQKLTILE